MARRLDGRGIASIYAYASEEVQRNMETAEREYAEMAQSSINPVMTLQIHGVRKQQNTKNLAEANAAIGCWNRACHHAARPF